jgi:hypothetical protein
MQDIVAQVLGVQGRNSRDGSKLMYDVALSDGQKYTTFDQGLAMRAQSLTGQVASARIDHKPNPRGGFFNNLEDIAPQGGLQQLALPGGTPIPMNGASTIPMGNPIPMAPPVDRFPPEVTTRNVKVSAFEIAFGFSALLHGGSGETEQAEAYAFDLAKRIYESARAHEQQTQPQPVVQYVPETPAAVAEQVNAEVGAGAVQTGSMIQW